MRTIVLFLLPLFAIGTPEELNPLFIKKCHQSQNNNQSAKIEKFEAELKQINEKHIVLIKTLKSREFFAFPVETKNLDNELWNNPLFNKMTRNFNDYIRSRERKTEAFEKLQQSRIEYLKSLGVLVSKSKVEYKYRQAIHHSEILSINFIQLTDTQVRNLPGNLKLIAYEQRQNPKLKILIAPTRSGSWHEGPSHIKEGFYGNIYLSEKHFQYALEDYNTVRAVKHEIRHFRFSKKRPRREQISIWDSGFNLAGLNSRLMYPKNISIQEFYNHTHDLKDFLRHFDLDDTEKTRVTLREFYSSVKMINEFSQSTEAKILDFKKFFSQKLSNQQQSANKFTPCLQNHKKNCFEIDLYITDPLIKPSLTVYDDFGQSFYLFNPNPKLISQLKQTYHETGLHSESIKNTVIEVSMKHLGTVESFFTQFKILYKRVSSIFEESDERITITNRDIYRLRFHTRQLVDFLQSIY